MSKRLPKLGGWIDPYLPDSSFEREGYSQRYLLYWESAYVLNVPIIKYILYPLISNPNPNPNPDRTRTRTLTLTLTSTLALTRTLTSTLTLT